ncbi:uncharacterized protein [Cicer arietinum]|uniref:Uncharacterized protein LOC101494666 isoform X2 n=1 Tax=Cicer arietinum TaxID=3827 RepID=A0A1S2XV23_CICAR|nr:uncharacterized protein LOC101494666 isoform X2 [Cicer arietinum]
MDKIKSHRTNSKLHLPQGNEQIHRQRQFPDLSPDSSSSSGGVAEKDSFSFKFGWKSSKQSVGTPIKKLLAEEMSPTAESKRRSPGVIARLMGLDGLPSQQPTNKQHKDPQKAMLSEKTRSRGMANDGRSSRRSSRDQQEFKDVFEVSEIPKAESGRYSSADLKVNEAEMSFIEQKFMDAKRLATYQDFQSSKDFHDTLEVLDSNKDLLLKYFKRPDSLFKKHLNDLQATPLQSHSGHIEPTNIENFEHDFTWRSDRETAQLNYKRFHQKHPNGHPCQFDKRRVMHNSPRSSKHHFKGSHEQGAVATKIVVLKPNMGKLQTGTRIESSPCSPHNFLSEHGSHAEFSDVRFRDTELYKKINLPDSARSFRHNSLESMEIAKEVTRQMRNSLNNGCTMSSSSRFKGYSRNDSSSSVSGNESPEESEEITATLGDPFDLNKRNRRSPRSSGSSVSKEAKKRLSERWKMTHKSQEVQVVSRSSTLADMLAFPGKRMKGTSSDSMTTGDKFARNGEPSGWVEPLGISSKDGWKDGYIGSLSRSKSLPTSSTAFGNPRSFSCAEALRNDRYMVPKESLKREKRRATKSLDHRHGTYTGSTKSGHKKSWSLLSLKQENNEFSLDVNAVQNSIEMNLWEDSQNVEVLAPECFDEALRDTSSVSDDVADVANKNTVGPSETSLDKVLPGSSSIKGDSSVVDKDNSMQEDLSAGGGISVPSEAPVPESPCSKDADQPSPISVLDPSFTDDLSSCSECFGSVSADLQGLRMQLQLLKLESEEQVEGPMLVSSDEDSGETSAGMLAGNGLCRTEDSWESSYIIDVLSESAIVETQPDTILEVWHSLERPVSLSVFEELEERYGDWTTCSRSERRLLFDRINSGIVKLHEQSADAQPWVGNTTINFGSKRVNNGLQDGLFRMLGNRGKVEDDALGKVLIGESQWLDLRNGIDVIGREVERLILDDLVTEIVGI